MSDIPEDLRYSESHQWLCLQEDGSVRVGITDFAQSALGDLVFVELPELGETYAADSECALVESVKSASDLICPVSGEITEVNEELDDAPELINSVPYDAGWIFAIMPEDENELDDLMDADGYRSFTESIEE
ncbi:MAG: glycine cleavage system protein GcvH [Gammaproteobacteria bacterium]